MNHTTDTSCIGGSSARRGFTLVEVLIVIGIIALLLGAAAATFHGVIGNSRSTKTQYIMSVLGQGIEMFHTDFNYYPPLLEDNWDSPNERLTSLLSRVTGAADNPLEQSRYHSIYTLPIYLLGQGDVNGDGILTYNDEVEEQDPSDATKRNLDDGYDGPGLRDPGSDKVWGAARSRNVSTVRPPTTGRVYGPYVDVEGTDIARRVRTEGEVDSESDLPPSFDESERMERENLYVFQDPWGTPIRYYRHWPTLAPGTTDQPSIDRVPIELVKPAAIVLSDEPIAGEDPELMRAPYALLSAGEDRLFGDRHAEGSPDLDHDMDDFIWAEDFADLGDESSGDMLGQLDLFRSQKRGRLTDNVRYMP